MRARFGRAFGWRPYRQRFPVHPRSLLLTCPGRPDDSRLCVMPDIAWHENYMSDDEYDEWVREENLSHSKATDVSLQHGPAHSSWFTVTILPLLCPSPILDFLLGCLLCQALAVLPKQFLISADAPASWVPMGARSLCLWRTNCSLRWNHDFG